MKRPANIKEWFRPWRILCVVALVSTAAFMLSEHLLRAATEQEAVRPATGETEPILVYEDMVIAVDTTKRDARFQNALQGALALAIGSGAWFWGHLRRFRLSEHRHTAVPRWYMATMPYQLTTLLVGAVFGWAITVLAMLGVPVQPTEAGDQRIIEAAWMPLLMLTFVAIGYIGYRLECDDMGTGAGRGQNSSH